MTLEEYCVRTDGGTLLLDTKAPNVSASVRKLVSMPKAATWPWYVRAGYRVVKVKVTVDPIEGSEWPAADELHEYDFKPREQHDAGS